MPENNIPQLVYPGSTKERLTKPMKKSLTNETQHQRYIESLKSIIAYIERMNDNIEKINQKININEFVLYALIDYLGMNAVDDNGNEIENSGIINNDDFAQYLNELAEQKMEEVENSEENKGDNTSESKEDDSSDDKVTN